jgi:hypothetical protein
VPSPRRARGVLLRLVRRRTPALLLGALLTVPALWGQLGRGYSAWWAEGLSLVLGATGIALIWAGLTKDAPDWVE